MPKTTHPHRGSLQYWPRKRSRHSLVRVRSWAKEAKPRLLGFIGYKVGMTHLRVIDNRPKSLTKGQEISIPATMIECPPLTVYGVVFYKNTKPAITILAAKLAKELSRKAPLPKKAAKTFSDVTDFDNLRLLVHSNPVQTGIGTKKPSIMEFALGGSKEEKLAYAQEVLGKEIKIADVFENGNLVDVHGVTKGKGFQGTVKRFGVPIRQHKAEKTKRGIGTLGPWHPKRVMFSVAQPGKMGFHLRTEYNKQIIKISTNPQEVNPAGGIISYGLVKSNFLFLKGSVVGPKKRAVVLLKSIRPSRYFTKDAPELLEVSK